MKTLIKPAVALCALVALAACQQQSPPEPAAVALDTPEQRLSYGVALGLGRNMANDGMTIDVDAFAEGLRDALSGAAQKLSDEDIQAEMVAFQQRIDAEREANQLEMDSIV